MNNNSSCQGRNHYKWFIVSGGLVSIFSSLTFASSVFVLFLDDLHLNKLQIGTILSLMPFCGVLSLLTAPFVARMGLKRAYITFYGARKFVMLAIVLFTPFIANQWGTVVGFYYVSGLMLIFALCRSLAETAYFPWSQEVVPVSNRGRFDAVSTAVSSTLILLAISLASAYLAHGSGINRFMFIMSVGVVIGVMGVVAACAIPGGAPAPGIHPRIYRQALRDVMRDKRFVLFLVGQSLIVIGSVIIQAFIPLYAKQVIGISISRILWIDISVSAAMIVCSYGWGWTADRYGSKPIALTAILVMILVPIGLICVPHVKDAFRQPSLIGIAALWGLGLMGSLVGISRLLNVNLVMEDRRMASMSLYYATSGLAGGIGTLFGGWFLNATRDFHPVLGGYTLDNFIFLWSLCLLFLGAAAVTLGRIKSEREMGFRDFWRHLLGRMWPGW